MRLFLLLFLAVLATAILPGSALAAAKQNEPLCLPSIYGNSGSDCLPAGSYAYTQRLAEIGLTFPTQPLPAFAPDPALSDLPYVYGHVTEGMQAPIFASIGDASAGKPVKRYLPPGFNYVSYVELIQVGGRKYYTIDLGEYMRGDSVSGGIAYTHFMGLQFVAAPTRQFGWVLQNIQARQGPSSSAELSQRSFVRFDVIQVYDTREADGITWHMVEPDLWIESKDAALVYPTSAAPAGVENGRWIEVNLLEQTLAVYENNQLIYATLLSSGVPGFWTRPGLFQIFEKLETTPMSGSFEADRSDYYYLEDVPWTMYFDGLRALHGAYWHTKLGYERSHGCVNLSPGDANWLFHWAVVGDWVYVWDPSGATPTDPSLYGEGGA